MGEGLAQYQNKQFLSNGREFIGDEDNCTMLSASSTSSSDGSCSSDLDTRDDASSSSNSYVALYDLSELMAQLPIKRGLSKYYQGKSESFRNLSRAISIDDLPKKAKFQTRREIKKSSRRNGHKKFILPNPDIKKKKTHGDEGRGSIFSSSFSRTKTSFNTCGSMPPLLHLQNTATNLGCN